jgi:hypothetical protein
MTRSLANIWWVVLGLGLALEIAWCGFSGQRFWPLWPRVGISSHHFDTRLGKVGYSVGSDFGRWQLRGQGRVQFVVIEGPVDPAAENFRGGDRVIFDAERTARVWLPVTRTRLINVNTGSPQSYALLGEQLTVRPLPTDFCVSDFERFLSSSEAKAGADGWRRWLESNRK